MARTRKKVIAKDYNSLIQISKDKIEKLTMDLKEEKANLKLLEKEAVLYEKQLKEEKKQEEMKEIAVLIEESGKTIDEIKMFLSSTTKKEK
ncbi:hypothetical protein [[Ruminococcus] torques]|jgi:hypothetical protein|uniref:hypothetical protein n=1 Tax=[Ruminococcus] torques TaxID=33039 RepID=UPI00205B465C|nr:MAG TPA: hypothetical protein [Caudoviricetes sp.]